MDITVLPTLHRRISQATLKLVLAFGLVGVLLCTGFFFAGRAPDSLVSRNYDSVALARQMSTALAGWRFPELYVGKDRAAWQTEFELALAGARANVTETGEQAAVDAVARSWSELLLAGPEDADMGYNHVRMQLNALVALNEDGIRQRIAEGRWWRDIVFTVGVALFLACTLWAFFQTDATAARIAHPLRRAAEVLQARPPLRKPLRLPAPQTLEVRILFEEFTRLWARLSQLDAVNLSRLIAEKNKLAVLLDAAEDAVLMLGSGGAVEHASSRMLALLGLTSKDVLGKVWADLSSTAPNYLALRAVLHSGLTGSRDIALADPEQPGDARGTGSERWFSARRRVVEESGRGARAVAGPKQTLGQVFLLTEITEKKRRDALRAEMMDWISHELKTPVQSLGLAADLLARRPESAADPDLSALVATVREDAARLRTVAAQFLDIARMSPHALELRPASLDLRDCLPRWLQPFEPAAREAGVTLHCDVAPGLPPVFLDQERFAWVLSNLVSNALRAVPEGGAVTVGAELEGEGLLALRVADNGPGIDAELAGRLFEPFSHRRAAGRRLSIAGLGLAISRAIVEGHGGTLHYTPAPEGGSIFTVCLPLPEQEAETGGGRA